MSAEYTIDELMVTTLAREFTNDTRAFNGAVSFVPVCAYLLARRTHAPDLVWAASSIAIDADPKSIPESTLSDGLWDGASMLANSAYDFWAYAQNRRYNTFAFRGAQMDAYGNVNNTTIGPYESPKVRLPGGGGMADLSCMIPLDLPLVDDPRPADVRREARLPLRNRLGRRRRPPRAARAPGRASALRHEPLRLRLPPGLEADADPQPPPRRHAPSR